MLQVGIVGLPNVGKSTLFKTLTKKQVDCANFPFCTIEPNVGVVEVPDPRVDKLAEVSKSEKKIPTAIEFVDIAGLVKGAHKGEGLGNQFLGNIRGVDMIVHVVRAFEDVNVHHVEGSIDAERDLEVIEIELAMADLVSVEKRLDNVRSKMKAGADKELLKEEKVLSELYQVLSDGKAARTVELDDEEEKMIKSLALLTRKPMLYLLNVGEDNLQNPPNIGADRLSMAMCVKIESEIMEMNKDEQQEFLKDLGLEQSGLDRLIVKCYELLDLITFLTSGEKETRAWTIKKGTKAPQAAGVIHTDFEKGFIRAEIINWQDFVELGEARAREAGKLRVEGKEYVMQDGDTCHFRFNV